MSTATWAIGLVIAVGLVLVVSEASPELTNGLLLLVLVGIILSRWAQIAPLVGLAGRVAGGQGPSKGKAPVGAGKGV